MNKIKYEIDKNNFNEHTINNAINTKKIFIIKNLVHFKMISLYSLFFQSQVKYNMQVRNIMSVVV